MPRFTLESCDAYGPWHRMNGCTLHTTCIASGEASSEEGRLWVGFGGLNHASLLMPGTVRAQINNVRNKSGYSKHDPAASR